MEKDDSDGLRAALLRALDLGMTHIDTAEMYGDGKVEEILGRLLPGRREEAFLVSKVLPWNATYDGTLRACERSLRRLRTDRLDLYLIHWREQVPLEEAFRALERLEAEGKILRYGVSNFDVQDLEEAVAIVGEGRIACNQVLYHLRERAIERRVIPWCEGHGIAVVAYSPFGQRNFPAPGGREWEALSRAALACGATPRQVALAFLTRRESVFAIPKSGKVAHVEENAGGGLSLPPAVVESLDRAFPIPPPGPLPML